MNVIVIGQPKSGTTALHACVLASLEDAEGPHRSEFEPSDLRTLDLSSRRIVAKKLTDLFGAHERPELADFDRSMLIHRDPRDRLVSWLLYDIYGRDELFDDHAFDRWIGFIQAKEQSPADVDLTDLLFHYWELTGINMLYAFGRSNDRLVDFMVACGSQVQTVAYEAFVHGDVGVIQDALGVDVVVPDLTGPESRVARTKSSGGWRHWVTDRDVAILRPFCADIFGLFGYDDEWETSPTPVIDPATTSTYVRSLRQRRLEERACGGTTDSSPL